MNRIYPEASVEDSPIALLYDCYAHRILIYLSRFALSEEDADDLVLEVFIAAMEKPVWITWSDREQLAWLQRIAHNKAVDHFRRVTRHPSIPLDHVAPLLYEDEGHAPEARALRNEDATQLRTHLSDLSDLQQEIIRLRFGHGLRSKDIAQRLNKSDSVVRVSLSRALQYLRGIYQHQEGERA
jgi:RNA polymerase sigma-70 factor (ECF subfamily)